jgi:hypothetical protein
MHHAINAADVLDVADAIATTDVANHATTGTDAAPLRIKRLSDI